MPKQPHWLNPASPCFSFSTAVIVAPTMSLDSVAAPYDSPLFTLFAFLWHPLLRAGKWLQKTTIRRLKKQGMPPLHCPRGLPLQHKLSPTHLQLNRNLLDRHRALHIWENHHHVAISIGFIGHLWLLGQHVSSGPSRHVLLQPTHAIAPAHQDEVVERAGLQVGDELLGGAAVHIHIQPVVLDLWEAKRHRSCPRSKAETARATKLLPPSSPGHQSWWRHRNRAV